MYVIVDIMSLYPPLSTLHKHVAGMEATVKMKNLLLPILFPAIVDVILLVVDLPAMVLFIVPWRIMGSPGRVAKPQYAPTIDTSSA